MSQFRDTSRWGPSLGPFLTCHARRRLLCMLCQGRHRTCPSRVSRSCAIFIIWCLSDRLTKYDYGSPVGDSLLFESCGQHICTSCAPQECFGWLQSNYTLSCLPHDLHQNRPRVRSCHYHYVGGGRCSVHTQCSDRKHLFFLIMFFCDLQAWWNIGFCVSTTDTWITMPLISQRVLIHVP